MKKTNSIKLVAASFLMIASGVSANAQTVTASGFVGNPLATQGSSLPTLISTPVASRSNPANALGLADNLDNGAAPIGFYSLGFGGTITLEMSGPICNTNGSAPDLTIFETSYGTPSCGSYPEKARVEVSQDGCKWVDLTESGPICQNASLDLGCLPWAKYVRISDVSDPSSFGSGADGFDVDAVEGIGGCAEPTETGLSRYAANGANATLAFAENGGAITPFRRNNTRMLGLPMNPSDFFANDGSTSPANNNFFSLGNGGSVVLSFPYTLFNGEGADVKVFETSFGDKASRSCGNYPEKASVEGSCDGETWFPLTILEGDAGNGEVAGTNVICRDGILDFNGNDAVNYIRITDLTFVDNSNFPGNGDGFDVDAVVGIQGCADLTANGKFAQIADDGSDVFEDALYIETYPNPTADMLNVSIKRVTKENVVIRIADITGRIIMTQNVNSKETSIIETLNLSNLTAGVYTITVESAGNREVQKVIKN
jgi:hypothetical protein